MNYTRPYNYIVATFLIVLYLAIPTASLAAVSGVEFSAPSVLSAASGPAAAVPCDTCPCSEGQDSDCCDTTFCNCACHAPLSRGVRLVYAPEIATLSYRELFRSLPHVYFSIFVPPQNLSALL